MQKEAPSSSGLDNGICTLTKKARSFSLMFYLYTLITKAAWYKQHEFLCHLQAIKASYRSELSLQVRKELFIFSVNG